MASATRAMLAALIESQRQDDPTFGLVDRRTPIRSRRDPEFPLRMADLPAPSPGLADPTEAALDPAPEPVDQVAAHEAAERELGRLLRSREDDLERRSRVPVPRHLIGQRDQWLTAHFTGTCPSCGDRPLTLMELCLRCLRAGIDPLLPPLSEAEHAALRRAEIDRIMAARRARTRNPKRGPAPPPTPDPMLLDRRHQQSEFRLARAFRGQVERARRSGVDV